MAIKQEELREKAKFLKWSKGINYLEMADAIGMTRNAFYNFVSGKKANLGYQKKKAFMDFAKRRENDE